MLDGFDDLSRISSIYDAELLRWSVDDDKTIVCCEIRDNDAFEAFELSGMKFLNGVFRQVSVLGELFQMHPFTNPGQI